MVKLNPEELRRISEEIDGIVTSHREILDHNPQISRSLIEARDAAKIKYETVSEHQRPGDNQSRDQTKQQSPQKLGAGCADRNRVVARGTWCGFNSASMFLASGRGYLL